MWKVVIRNQSKHHPKLRSSLLLSCSKGGGCYNNNANRRSLTILTTRAITTTTSTSKQYQSMSTSCCNNNNNNNSPLYRSTTTVQQQQEQQQQSKKLRYYNTTSYIQQQKQQQQQQQQQQDVPFEGVSEDVNKIIYDYANQPQTSVSLQALMRTGRGEYLHKTFLDSKEFMDSHTATELVLIQVASFLRRELPIRLAHRIQDLERVPLMRDMKSVKEVKELYTKSLLDIVEFDDKIMTPNQEEQFAKLVETIYERHSKVLVQMARGAYEFRNQLSTNETNPKDTFTKMDETHAFLDRFYLCRIGIRVLIGQYLALRQPPVENYIGIICSVTSPYEIVKRAIDDAAFMCTRKYGDAPEVIMSGRLDLAFPYVPTHLHYILLELLKNSMRATVEWHGIDADYPPIKVIIADGNDNEDVVIKVSDEGGGIPRSNTKKIWSYLFTTADPAIQDGMVGSGSTSDQVDHGIDSPLAGLGYGLPISRSYCRYFGGDLSIMSMEGYGTDAFVYLARLGNTREPLPI